ncbi:SULT1C2 [Bugula neritina]|uniref:SULT1C2 n=1 Tax=Bugula neritina TaxID=10212 RepID=A0A7J7JE40_BUGNE|nr:SULT1C2 [Bugula neritina]
MRNSKDVSVSFYFHMSKLLNNMIPDHEIGTMFNQMTLEEFVAGPLWSKEQPFGSYFDFIEYMWSLRTKSNVLIVFFEEIKLNAFPTIQKINEFMGTNRGDELIHEIAAAIDSLAYRQNEGRKS